MTPKSAPSGGDPGPHLIRGSLGPTSQPKRHSSILLAFKGLTLVTNQHTDTHTDHATYVATDRILSYALQCGLITSVSVLWHAGSA